MTDPLTTRPGHTVVLLLGLVGIVTAVACGAAWWALEAGVAKVRGG